jgi:hypothetical protein
VAASPAPAEIVLTFGARDLPFALLHVTGDHVLCAFADLLTARAVASALAEEHSASGADPNREPFEYQLVDARTGRPPPCTDHVDEF